MNQVPISWILGNQSLPGTGGQQNYMDPRMMSLMAYIMASRMEGGEGQPPPQSTEEPVNPYVQQHFRPMPTNLSPLGRFNDMALRQSAALADRLNEGKGAVAGSLADTSERQRIVDSITHPPPAMPYSISRPGMDAGPIQNVTQSPAYLDSAYGPMGHGGGSVTFAPPGTPIHGRFGPEGLPFGQIGGRDEAQPTSGDPLQTTYQQQMMLDAINKATGKKKK